MRFGVPIIFTLILCRCGNSNSELQQRQLRQEDSIKAAWQADSVHAALIREETNMIRSLNTTSQAENLAYLMSFDTVTKNGNFIRHYYDSVENVYCYWGTASGDIIDTMFDESGGYAGLCMAYLGETEKYLAVYTQGQGFISGLWLLPLNRKDSIQSFHSLVAHDLNLHLVLANDVGDNFTLTDFHSHKKHTESLPGITRPMYGIPMFDDLVFRANEVILGWSDKDGKTYTSQIKL